MNAGAARRHVFVRHLTPATSGTSVKHMKLTPLAYSIAEACALSSVGRTTLYAAIARGDLKTHKVGRRTLISAQDLKSWLDSCSTTVASNQREDANGLG